MGLDKNDEVIGYKFVRLGKMMEDIRNGVEPREAYEKTSVRTEDTTTRSSTLTRAKNKEGD